MNEYKYFGIELSPSIFAEFLIKLFDGKQFKRATAIEEITKYHKDRGGLLEKHDYVSVFKKASNILSKNGLTNVGYGVWRLNYKVHEINIVEEKPKEAVEYTADITIGIGCNAIYVYYYDSYRKLAKKNGENIWECKIGRTDKDPLQRIFSQAGTCYPEYPHVALIIKCDNSFHLETALHNILKLRNRWIANAPGTEWFLTSPSEVEDIYYMIMGNPKSIVSAK